MPKSSIARRTPSARSSFSRLIARSVSVIITDSVISSVSASGSRPGVGERGGDVGNDVGVEQLLDRQVDPDRRLHRPGNLRPQLLGLAAALA